MIATIYDPGQLQMIMDWLMSEGIITGFSTRDNSYEIPPTESVTQQQLAAAFTACQATLAQRKTWTTVADFYAEFTGTEKYLIQSSTVPAIVVARGDLAMWRGDVWSDNTDVLAGLDAMVEAKVITPERKAEILSK